MIRLQGKTEKARHEITAAASAAIGEAGGYVLDYQQFSNLAVCFTLELPPTGFARLRRKLTDLGVLLEAPTPEEIAAGAKTSEASDIPGSLRLEFLHHEPDLRIPIPAVPG